MNEITEQEMAAVREEAIEILCVHYTEPFLRSPSGNPIVSKVATIIHKHNEGLWNQWVAKWQATVDTLGNANARAIEAEQQRDQLAARCAELEKALTKLASMVWESRWVSEEQDYQDSVAFAAELRSDLISSPSSSLTRLQELECKAKVLDDIKNELVEFDKLCSEYEHDNASVPWISVREELISLLQAIESATRKEK